jgi:hypothetical protein
MVSAGFVEVAEMLGLLHASAGPPETLEEPPTGPEPEKLLVAERRSTRIETPLNSPLLAAAKQHRRFIRHLLARGSVLATGSPPELCRTVH